MWEACLVNYQPMKSRIIPGSETESLASVMAIVPIIHLHTALGGYEIYMTTSLILKH